MCCMTRKCVEVVDEINEILVLGLNGSPYLVKSGDGSCCRPAHSIARPIWVWIVVILFLVGTAARRERA